VGKEGERGYRSGWIDRSHRRVSQKDLVVATNLLSEDDPECDVETLNYSPSAQIL
jgi:hypothetical protein